MSNVSPVGIFDSGIGGLTVVKKISSILPSENIVYFGDTARVPYGTKSNDTVIEYALQDAAYLLTHHVKLIIVACNTASSVALPALRERFDVPVIGMIEPGAKLAVEKSKNGKIGVIGTNATVNNKAYSTELLKYDTRLEIFEKACPLFVPLAEEGWIDHKATKLIADEYLHGLKEHEIDTLILGCTHYPILSGVIQSSVGNNVELIDSGVAASLVVKNYLEKENLLNPQTGNGKIDFYVSDLSSKFKEIAGRFLGKPVDEIKKVDVDELVKLI